MVNGGQTLGPEAVRDFIVEQHGAYLNCPKRDFSTPTASTPTDASWGGEKSPAGVYHCEERMRHYETWKVGWSHCYLGWSSLAVAGTTALRF